MKPEITNPNSSGQGFHASGPSHPLAPIVTAAGYEYSHSTPVGYRGDRWRLLHTFRHPGGSGEHTVSLMTEGDGEPRDLWDTCTSPASGHQWSGKAAPELKAHLASKGRRYGLAKARKPSTI